MLKRNLVLATLLATLSITACSKKRKKPQLTVSLKPQQAQRVKILKTRLQVPPVQQQMQVTQLPVLLPRVPRLPKAQQSTRLKLLPMVPRKLPQT